MASNLSVNTITWYDESDGYSTSAEITDDVVNGIPIFTDTGSGEINEAEIQLPATGGVYIHTGNAIDKFDRIRFQFTDLSSNSYDRFYEVIEIIPSQTKQDASLVTLKLHGIEYHTQSGHYTAQHFYTNPKRVAKLIAAQYNSNIGTRQPTIDRHDEAYSLSNAYGNGLPDFTLNHFEFGLAEDTYYNRLLDLTDSQGASVEVGGVGRFFELGFDTPSVNAIDIALFKSGARTIDGTDTSNDGSLITIVNTDSINLGEQEGGIGNPTATQVLVWGSSTHGTLPIGLSKYRAGELEFTFRPRWAPGIDYETDAKVVYNGKHYKATSDHTSSNSNDPEDVGAPWSQIDMSDEFGDSVQYSGWTDDKAGLWANGGSRPNDMDTIPAWATSTAYTAGDLVSQGGNNYVATTKHTSGTFATDLSNGKMELVDNAFKGNGAGFFDSNRAIREEEFLRTWVHEVIGDTDYSGTSDQTANAAYRHANGQWPLGHRLLNISNTELSGNDIYGKSFENAIVERVVDPTPDPNTTQWRVILSPDSTTDRMQVVDKQDGKTWEWNDSASEWQEITTEEFGNDCFHEYKSIYNIHGADKRPSETDSTKYPEITKDAGIFATNQRTAVEVAYEWPNILSAAITADGYKKGAWLDFSFPFPLNTFNSISEGVGDLYGGGTNEAVPVQPSFFDTNNMTYTPTGLQGFNQTDSEELGQVAALSFLMRIAIEDAAGNRLGGTLNMRVCICDRKDNLVIQDFELKFSDGLTWETVNLPISGFTNYRARKPKSFLLRGLSVTGFELPLNDIDVQNVFEWRNIKDISIQIQDFYDGDGRYAPDNNIVDFDNTGFMTALGGTCRMAIDAFHFKKALLASSGTVSTRTIQPKFLQQPNIISYNQAANYAKSQLEIEQFQHKEFNFTTSGDSLFDIRFGDSFFLQNADIVSDTDDTANPSEQKIKLVAKRVEYHITKPTAGPGGVTRSIKGVKVFTS